MIGWLSSALGFAEGILDRVLPKKLTEEERAKALVELQRMVEERDAEAARAARDVIVAEMQSGDAYTRRARPTIVYVGLALIVYNYAVRPSLLPQAPPVDFPDAFWWAWTGVVGIWVGARSWERRGAQGKSVGWITGGLPLGPLTGRQ